jgi:hypothetical protein
MLGSEKKIEDVLWEDQCGFRNGKGTRDANGTFDIGEEICICFIDWQKAFDRVKWTKLMEILKKTGIDWRERRLISTLYMGQSVKVRLHQGVTKSVKIGRGVRQGCCLSPLLFNLYSIQQEEDSLHQQIRLRAKEEISEVLHWEHSFVWCGNLDSSETKSEVPGKI